MYRVNYLSWWKEELPSEDEYQTARANLEKAGWEVDYIITHCCPTSVQDELSGGFYEYLPPLQQNHRGANPPDVSALPFLLWIFPQSIVVFMISRYKGRSEGDDEQVRMAIEKITVLDPETIRIQFKYPGLEPRPW